MTINSLVALAVLTTSTSGVLVANSPALPQEKAGHGCGHGRMMGGHFGRGLDLTQAQRDQVKTYVDEMKAAKEKIANDAALSDEARSAQRQAVREQLSRLMDSVLTSEQRAKRDANRAERKARMEQHRAEFEKALGLTPTQKSQLEALRSEARAAFENARGKATGREAMRAIHEALRAKRDSILTPSQRETIKSMRGHHGRKSQRTAPVARPLSI